MKITVSIPITYTTTVDIPSKCLTKDQIEELTNSVICNLHSQLTSKCYKKLNKQLVKIEESIYKKGFSIKNLDNFYNYIYFKE